MEFDKVAKPPLICFFFYLVKIPKPLLNIFLIYVCYCLQDVTMKIISFSQQGPRAICILSANGIISNVALRQPYSSGGTLTYEVCIYLHIKYRIQVWQFMSW